MSQLENMIKLWYAQTDLDEVVVSINCIIINRSFLSADVCVDSV